MFLLIVFAVISLLAIVLAIRDVASDGYRRVPTRPNAEERLPRYR